MATGNHLMLVKATRRRGPKARLINWDKNIPTHQVHQRKWGHLMMRV